jgi:hypothetical protein
MGMKNKLLLLCATVGGFACNDLGDAMPMEIHGLANRVQGEDALWAFEEAAGYVVHDVSDNGEPVDLLISEPGATEWIGGGLRLKTYLDNNLNEIDGTTLVATSAADKITSACMASGEMSVEIWATFDVQEQGTIISQGRSGDAVEPTGDFNYIYRHAGLGATSNIRTTQNESGNEQASSGDVIQISDLPQHITFTREALGDRNEIYINGVQTLPAVIGGDFSNWGKKKTLDYRFTALGRYDGQDRWLGDIYMLAVWCRKLTPEEIVQNVDAGP